MANKRGRPPAIKNVNELDSAIDAYYLECQETGDIFTMIGLAVFMGIAKDTLFEYAKKPLYSDSYKKAMALAEKALVNGSLTGKYNAVVSIFMLKNNHDYTDKKEVAMDVTSPEFSLVVKKPK